MQTETDTQLLHGLEIWQPISPRRWHRSHAATRRRSGYDLAVGLVNHVAHRRERPQTTESGAGLHSM